MPKTKLQTRLPSQARLGILLSGSLKLRGYSVSNVSEILDCSEPTARSRLRHPGTFTVDELTRLAKHADIPIEELRAAISYQ